MMHGFLLEGERSVEAIAVQSRLTMNKTAEFLEKFVSILDHIFKCTYFTFLGPLSW